MSDDIKSSTGAGGKGSLDITDPTTVTLMPTADTTASGRTTYDAPPPVFEVGSVLHGLCFIQMI